MPNRNAPHRAQPPGIVGYVDIPDPFGRSTVPDRSLTEEPEWVNDLKEVHIHGNRDTNTSGAGYRA
jgi:hypothetical protein